MAWLPVFGIVNVRTDVDACYCTLGLYGHRKRLCIDSGRKIPCRTAELNPRQYCSWFFGLSLSFIPRTRSSLCFFYNFYSLADLWSPCQYATGAVGSSQRDRETAEQLRGNGRHDRLCPHRHGRHDLAQVHAVRPPESHQRRLLLLQVSLPDLLFVACF